MIGLVAFLMIKGGNYMVNKYWRCIVVWIGMMCGMGSMVFHPFLPPLMTALIGFIGLSILVASVIYLLNKM